MIGIANHGWYIVALAFVLAGVILGVVEKSWAAVCLGVAIGIMAVILNKF